MKYDPLRHHRRSIRLRGHDYAQAGMYYVTLTIQDRENILGSVIGDKIELSRFGEIVHKEWERTPILRPEVILDEFVIMPDHLHGIIVICEERNGVILSSSSLVGANCHSPQRLTPFVLLREH